MKKDAKYKFKSNILELSHNSDIKSALKEWVFIKKETRTTKDIQCVCESHLKKVNYLFNPKTNNWIGVGTKCITKFTIKNRKGNEYLRKAHESIREKCEYSNIEDMKKYSESIKKALLELLQKEFDKNLNLRELSENIHNLIQDYELHYLQDIYEKVCTQIDKSEKEAKKVIDTEREAKKVIDAKREALVDAEREALVEAIKVIDAKREARREAIKEAITESVINEQDRLDIVGNAYYKKGVFWRNI